MLRARNIMRRSANLDSLDMPAMAIAFYCRLAYF